MRGKGLGGFARTMLPRERCSPSEALHRPVNLVIIIPTALGKVLIPP